MNARAFGDWLIRHRKRLGLSQDKLAELVSCSPSYISTLERATPHSKTKGVIRPSEELVDTFADVLGGSVNEARQLAGYASAYEEQDLPLFRLKNILRKVPKENQERIERLLEQDAENYIALLSSAA